MLTEHLTGGGVLTIHVVLVHDNGGGKNNHPETASNSYNSQNSSFLDLGITWGVLWRVSYVLTGKEE